MLRLIFKYLGKFFNKRGYKEGDNIRADVFPQIGMLWSAILLVLFGAAYGIYGYYKKEYIDFIVTVLGIVAGVAAFLYWKNYKIKLITSDKFEYTNMFGKKSEFYLSEMTRYRFRGKNYTFYFGDKKVPIDSVCYISEQFSSRLKAQMDTMIVVKK